MRCKLRVEGSYTHLLNEITKGAESQLQEDK